MWEERSWLQNSVWNVQKGWKAESLWWRDRVQLLHERKTTSKRPQAERWRKCTVETLSCWAQRNRGRVFNETNQRVQKLPDKTSERSSPDWNVYSWLCNEFQSRVPPSSPGKSCSSDRAPRRAGGWNRPSPASWRRQRKGRKEEGSRQKLANATTFFNTFTFLFLTLCLFQTLSVYAWWRTELYRNCCKLQI